MEFITSLFENIGGVYKNSPIDQLTVFSVLAMVSILAIYEFAVYRFVSHRSFYNKSFNLAIAILPYFISTIILCLQSNVVITLGTIGALAIIRFRTAVKDPVDMIYLLWSIHTGIICGCQLFPVAVITSIAVTIFLIILDNFHLGKRPHIVVIQAKNDSEEKIRKIFSTNSRSFRIKSRNYSGSGVNYTVEATIKDPKDLARRLKNAKKIERFSIIEYDADDLV